MFVLISYSLSTCSSSFSCRMKLKYMKLKEYLEEINKRQKRALLRNQAILKELNQFEAHTKTSISELIQKMEVTF